jgi:Na+/proline symporter
VVLSIILGWPEQFTTIVMGATVVSYTMVGGIKAVTWSDVQQMGVIFLGLILSLITVFVLLPSSVSIGDAVYLAGAAGRLNAVTTQFDWHDQFNMWSGLLGATFLFLSYFVSACCSTRSRRSRCSSSSSLSARWCSSFTSSCSPRCCSIVTS